MTYAVSDQQLTVVGAAVYHSHGARLFTPRINEYTEEKKNIIYLYAAVDLKRK